MVFQSTFNFVKIGRLGFRQPNVVDVVLLDDLG